MANEETGHKDHSELGSSRQIFTPCIECGNIPTAKANFRMEHKRHTVGRKWEEVQNHIEKHMNPGRVEEMKPLTQPSIPTPPVC